MQLQKLTFVTASNIFKTALCMQTLPLTKSFWKKVSTEFCACNFFWIDTLLDTIHIVRGKQAISDCHKTLTKLFCFWFFRKCTVAHFEWRKRCQKNIKTLIFFGTFYIILSKMIHCVKWNGVFLVEYVTYIINNFEQIFNKWWLGEVVFYI